MAEVTLVEVGPRDGLQNEPRPVATEDKIRLIDLLSAAGLRRIEAASFVSPKWVPQMADGRQVMAGIARRPGVTYSALTPNLRGFEAALAAGVDEAAVFAAASETFSARNVNATIDESFARFRPVAESAAAAGVGLRGYVSCVTDCPYEGPTPPERVAEVVARLFDLGCGEVSLGETLGRATPEATARMLEAVLGVAPAGKLAGHFHDTGGRALENIEVCLERGLTVFDAAAGGLGGCPYAPGAAGNVATEAVAARLADLGHETGVDAAALGAAADFARSIGGPMSEATITLAVDGRGVARLTLDRPEKRNALSAATCDALTAAAAELNADRGVRAVVLAGAGATFCAGGDLDWMRAQFDSTRETRLAEARRLARMLQALNTLARPLIARVQGAAFGGGVGLASVCDAVVAAEDAQFGLTEVKLGLIPATISPYVIARMGEGRARSVFFSGRVFGAVEAQALGLVTRIAAAAEMDEAVEAEVAPYLAAAPGAVAAAKRLARSLGPRIDEAVIEDTIARLADVWETEEARAGIAAFFERRPAPWAR